MIYKTHLQNTILDNDKYNINQIFTSAENHYLYTPELINNTVPEIQLTIRIYEV